MKGRYFLNHKGNVPDLKPEDRKLVGAILFGLLLVVGVYAYIIYENSLY